MPAIAEIVSPPASVLDDLAALRGALDSDVPAKDATNLLIGTWNIRAFGSLTSKWRADADDSPKRNLADLTAIAEIVSRFDVCAVQETRGNMTALRTLMRRLGKDWGFVVTDVGEGKAANNERLAYVFDRRAVRFSGLAGELVIAEEEFGKAATPLRNQFARTPYMVSFETGPTNEPVGFTLISLHIDFGTKPADRTPEIQTFANRLKEHAEDPDEFGRNMIALGDFNIDRWLDDPNADAFRSEGLTPPLETARDPSHDLRRPHQTPLLRPDRLVHRRQPHRPYAQVRTGGGVRELGPTPAYEPGRGGEVVAHLRPLPALGKIPAPIGRIGPTAAVSATSIRSESNHACAMQVSSECPICVAPQAPAQR